MTDLFEEMGFDTPANRWDAEDVEPWEDDEPVVDDADDDVWADEEWSD